MDGLIFAGAVLAFVVLGAGGWALYDAGWRAGYEARRAEALAPRTVRALAEREPDWGDLFPDDGCRTVAPPARPYDWMAVEGPPSSI